MPTTTETEPGTIPRAAWLDTYRRVRQVSDRIVAPLSPEDTVVQSMPDVSPTRWHLAHTTWFFETFVLKEFVPNYQPVHPQYESLFNSYYNTIGEPFPRPLRGLLSRPGLGEVLAYRQAIDERIAALLDAAAAPLERIAPIIEVGLNHEQQHQELMLTDIKHVLSCNPLWPAYRDDLTTPQPAHPRSLAWQTHAPELTSIGYAGDGFCFDNERPRHKVYLEPFELADRPITNGEYREFIEDGGYQRPELWLSAGWQTVQDQQWTAPLYWQRIDNQWHEFTLGGLRPLEASQPVCHVSYFEADAFARWKDCRLPTEAEWETAACAQPVNGNWLDFTQLHPRTDSRNDGEAGLCQLFGDVWEWTASPYVPYPGYRPPAGAIGEYNGKFMCNQFVLRGGSCATPAGHVRATYRNFFPPDARWQFSGIRLAR